MTAIMSDLNYERPQIWPQIYQSSSNKLPNLEKSSFDFLVRLKCLPLRRTRTNFNLTLDQIQHFELVNSAISKDSPKTTK